MIAVDNEPFNIVRRDGFQWLMTVLEPRYTLPSDNFQKHSYQVCIQRYAIKFQQWLPLGIILV